MKSKVEVVCVCTLTVFDVFGLWWCFESKSDDGISRFLLFFSSFFAFYKHRI